MGRFLYLLTAAAGVIYGPFFHPVSTWIHHRPV